MIHLPRIRGNRLVAAAVLLVSAAAPAALTTPAHAAGCSDQNGVTVVVDFAELGGGVTAGCAQVPDGTRAKALLQAAGYSTTMATKSAGFVCRVNGVPASDPCVNAAPSDAYWSVWWANGTGGSWVYSARGVESLRVPDGGYLAMAWHEGSGRSQPPATVPVSRAPKPAPEPTKQPTSTPTSKPSAKPTATTKQTPRTETNAPVTPRDEPARPSGPEASSRPAASNSENAPPSTDPSPTPATGSPATASPSPAGTPSPGETVSVAPTLVPADQITAGPETVSVDTEGDAGLPSWVPVSLIAIVAGVGGIVVVRRRKAQA